MRSFSTILLFLCTASLACHSRPTVKEPQRDEQTEKPLLDVQNVGEVRMVFHVIDYDEMQKKQRRYLIRMREKAFPTYEVILSDTTSKPYEVEGVLWALWYGEADPHRFLKNALSRLSDIDYHVRWAAVRLLGRIGSPAEASQVIPLLSDGHKIVASAAARTLAAIGGPNEVVAIDIWLRDDSHRDDQELREHVQKCRDELVKRLAECKDPKK